MGDLLFNIQFTPRIIYLSLLLLVIGKCFKDITFTPNFSIIWINFIISLIVSLVIDGFSINSLFEAIIATSLATTYHQAYKQTRKGIRYFRGL